MQTGKVQLTEEKETMLLALYSRAMESRAMESRSKDPLLRDTIASGGFSESGTGVLIHLDKMEYMFYNQAQRLAGGSIDTRRTRTSDRRL
jgi:O-methyltransferase involved in polyketide biosynthesis